MKERIRQRARELGFEACGFAAAQPPPTAPRFQEWLERGCQGEMEYLRRTAPRRMDPRRVLPGARTAIVLAAHYLPPGAAGNSGPVARYARYDDYHEVLGRALDQLITWLDAWPAPGEPGGAAPGSGAKRFAGYVDTGPVLERALAQEAGLGFIGKHTNLVLPQAGNWAFLAVILATLELPPDAPAKNRCGACARCLAACPTRAITAPYQLDARRCLAYWTIEAKGDIPEELRPALGDRVFGCDDCLAACPWNRFAAGSRMLKPFLRPELCAPDLAAWLRLDEAGFKTRFQGTPLERLKHRRFLRNACVVAGNLGLRGALPILEALSRQADPLVAGHAGWAVRRIESRGAHRAGLESEAVAC